MSQQVEGIQVHKYNIYKKLSENKYNIMLMWNKTLQRCYTAKCSSNKQRKKKR